MIKIILFSLSLLVACSLTFAQDTIVKIGGEKIECTILEVTPIFVKCNKFNSEDKEVYRFLVEGILMIKYMDGETTLFIGIADNETIPLSTKNGVFIKDVYLGEKKLTPLQVRKLYEGNSEALSKYNSGRTLSTIGSIIGLPSAFVLGWQFGSSIGGGEINKEALIISGAGTAVGMILALVGDSSIKQSVNIYNSKIDSNASVQLNIGFTTVGVGLCLSF
ncbi:MAG: hypothetical protein QM503_14490 [Bacteroidota bacterium]